MRLPGFSHRVRTPDANGPPSGRMAVLDPASLIGHKALGRYELLQLIGEGSNGEVYLARDSKQPELYVVVKRIKPQLLQNPRFRQFFDSEVASMMRFTHPYAVQLFEASLSDDLGPCLILEYIHGVTLEAVLNHYRRLPAEHVGKILGQFCHALQAAHDAGIMHRDLKPANVMVTNFGTPKESLKVMDFGFAGFTEKPHIQLAELTGHGQNFACGTPAYVSPEMIRGDNVDARADIYSVGVMIYELLTGRLPHDYATVDEILKAHISKQAPRFKQVGITDIPSLVEGVVHLSMAKFPNERHQTPRDLCQHYSQAIGIDFWSETAPAGYRESNKRAAVSSVSSIQAPEAGSAASNFILSDKFEALLPPRLATAKLRGFVDDFGGVVTESEPGVIRMRFGLPSGYKDPSERSGLFNLLNVIRKMSVASGQEPIEVALQMKKVQADPNRVRLVVSFHPMAEYMPSDPELWAARCEQVNSALRMYLMANA
ncbi:MAG: serine/threonine-protein kinase [Gemmataceae bacterium]